MSDEAKGLIKLEEGQVELAAGQSVELPDKQVQALEALKEGKSFIQASRAAGVNRSTLYRWLQSDPHFRAAYNLWQRELVESAQSRLLKLTDKAVDVVEKALVRQDEKIAMQLLRETGALRPARKRLIDPKLLQMQMMHQDSRREHRLDMAVMNHLLSKMGLSKSERREYIRQHGAKPSAEALALPEPAEDQEQQEDDDPAEDATSDATNEQMLHDLADLTSAQDPAD